MQYQYFSYISYILANSYIVLGYYTDLPASIFQSYLRRICSCRYLYPVNHPYILGSLTWPNIGPVKS